MCVCVNKSFTPVLALTALVHALFRDYLTRFFKLCAFFVFALPVRSCLALSNEVRHHVISCFHAARDNGREWREREGGLADKGRGRISVVLRRRLRLAVAKCA